LKKEEYKLLKACECLLAHVSKAPSPKFQAWQAHKLGGARKIISSLSSNPSTRAKVQLNLALPRPVGSNKAFTSPQKPTKEKRNTHFRSN